MGTAWLQREDGHAGVRSCLQRSYIRTPLAESRSRRSLRRRDDINQRHGSPSNIRRVRLQRSRHADGRRGRTRLLLATVLRRHKTMRAVLFDLPHVAAGAAATFARVGITGRVRIESGDFFKELPSGADAIIMKHILHDWDDDSATRILQACHRALGPRGKVLIVDPVVPSGNAPHYGKLLDLEMLVLTPRGRERTKAEFVRLLRGAGFRLSRVIATESPLSIVEAVKA